MAGKATWVWTGAAARDVTGHVTDPARQEMTERQKRARRAQIALYRHRIFVDDPAQVLQCVPHLQ